MVTVTETAKDGKKVITIEIPEPEPVGLEEQATLEQLKSENAVSIRMTVPESINRLVERYQEREQEAGQRKSKKPEILWLLMLKGVDAFQTEFLTTQPA